MIKRSAMLSIRIQNKDLDDLEKMIKTPLNPNGKYNNMSQAIRELAKMGAQIVTYIEMMKDSKKSNEFLAKMNEIIKNENFEEFAQTLDTQQIEGFLMLLKIEKEKRYDQKIVR